MTTRRYELLNAHQLASELDEAPIAYFSIGSLLLGESTVTNQTSLRHG
jgi:hypothetical protein